jgi:Phage terminase, small subunit
MGRQRDPKRDEAKELYKAAGGEINLTEIAAKLGVSDGTVRGWKAKDKWEHLLTGDVVEVERSDTSKVTERNVSIKDIKDSVEEPDELFINAVRIVAEAKQASVSLLQRRLRVGYSRAARLVDEMERRKFVGPYKGDRPRDVYATIQTVEELEKEVSPKRKERSVPIVPLERSENTERSEKERNVPIEVKEPEPELPEVPDDEGLTPKQRIFVMEYLRDFNATRAAIATGYSKKTAYSIGWELLRKPEIKSAIQRYSEMFTAGLGLNIQRVIAEYMKIAFADMNDFTSFGKEDMPLFNKKGNPILKEDGSQMTQAVSYVDLKNDSEVDGTVISEVKQGKDGVSVKLYDKMRALKELEKYLGFMSESDKLKVEKLRLEVDKLKNGDGDSDDDLIEDWVEAVTGEDEVGGEEEA